MRRKILCAALAAAMVGSLASCNENDVDYSVDGGVQTNEAAAADTSALARALSVPAKCDVTFDTGKSNLKSITLKDDQIVVPDVDKVYIVSFETADVPCTEEKLGAAIKELMDESEGIQQRSSEGEQTKTEIATTIESLKAAREAAAASGDDDSVEMFDDTISNLEDQMETAPDALPQATEYKLCVNYVGTKDGIGRTLVTYTSPGGEADNSNNAISYGMTYDGERSAYLGEVEGATETYTEKISEQGEAYEYSGANPITEDEAEETAMKLLDLFGLSGFAPTEMTETVRLWTDSAGETLYTRPEGYGITLSRQIDGMEVVYPDNNYMYSLDNIDFDGVSLPEGDNASVQVNESGVAYAYISVYADEDTFDKEEVTLLSWDKLLEAANTSIAEYYKEHPTDYRDVEFSDVKLAYVPCSDGEGGKCFIPAWIFSQSEYDDIAEGVAATQLVYINAVDGSYIDIEDTMETLGMKSE